MCIVLYNTVGMLKLKKKKLLLNKCRLVITKYYSLGDIYVAAQYTWLEYPLAYIMSQIVIFINAYVCY